VTVSGAVASQATVEQPESLSDYGAFHAPYGVWGIRAVLESARKSSLVISGAQWKRKGSSAERPRLTCMMVGEAWNVPEE